MSVAPIPPFLTHAQTLTRSIARVQEYLGSLHPVTESSVPCEGGTVILTRYKGEWRLIFSPNQGEERPLDQCSLMIKVAASRVLHRFPELINDARSLLNGEALAANEELIKHFPFLKDSPNELAPPLP